jgi:hypothetical protein
MKLKLIPAAFFFFCCFAANAQDNNYGVKGFNPKTFTVTDSLPVTFNGLKAGYEIKDESEKSVGKKGDFSRFKIKFYLTNVSSEAKIMYRNLDFGGHSGPITNNMALFKCLNATGARFTNKMAMMELQPCKIQAMVDNNKVMADIGYWIKPGETVSKTYPMIVPLNEKPNVTITFYAEVGNQTGTLMNQAALQQEQNFVRLKNFSSNTYLHTESGPVTTGTIDNNWWSAQWEIQPVSGTENFQIRNRAKNSFLCSGSNTFLCDDAQSQKTMWMIQETNIPNIFYIKNATDNARLYIENGTLKISSSFINNDALTKWIIEK